MKWKWSIYLPTWRVCLRMPHISYHWSSRDDLCTGAILGSWKGANVGKFAIPEASSHILSGWVGCPITFSAYYLGSITIFRMWLDPWGYIECLGVEPTRIHFWTNSGVFNDPGIIDFNWFLMVFMSSKYNIQTKYTWILWVIDWTVANSRFESSFIQKDIY